MIFKKSTFMNVFVIFITGGIITFVLLIFKLFVPGLIGIGLLCILFPILARLSSEEWAIFVLKRHNGFHKYSRNLGCSLKAISRLERKGIVIIEDGNIRLVNCNHPCLFDEPDE